MKLPPAFWLLPSRLQRLFFRMTGIPDPEEPCRRCHHTRFQHDFGWTVANPGPPEMRRIQPIGACGAPVAGAPKPGRSYLDCPCPAFVS